MIKRLICLLCVAVTAAACNRPRNIPDEKLIAITREIFLANAYRDSPKSGFSQADTVDFYTPIFEKYGYKPSDLSYTINNLSRRKSVRFTDILEEVARRLDREDSLMKARIATLDTVDSRTMNRYRRVVYSDSTRQLRRLSDPDKPDIVLPVRPGRYQVAFKYDLDTSSRNGNLRYTHYQFDTTDGTKGSFYYLGYIKGAQKQEIFSFDVTDPKTNEVRISLATSPSDKEKSIALRIDSMTITYFLPLREAADSLIREIFRFNPSLAAYNLPSNASHVADKKEIIGALYPDTTGTAAQRDSVVRR